jgi:hypothetical protein
MHNCSEVTHWYAWLFWSDTFVCLTVLKWHIGMFDCSEVTHSCVWLFLSDTLVYLTVLKWHIRVWLFWIDTLVCLTVLKWHIGILTVLKWHIGIFDCSKVTHWYVWLFCNGAVVKIMQKSEKSPWIIIVISPPPFVRKLIDFVLVNNYFSF